MASRPAILLIPGSFSIAAMYYPLQDILVAQGHEVYVNNLPSASRNAPEPPASLSDDTEFFSNIIGKIADQGKDIIVLGHSYGGLVASESAKGHSKVERCARGQKGGITRIVFLAAIVLQEGQSLVGHQGKPPPSIVKTDENGFMRLANPALSGSRMYDVWPEERALAWARAAPKHSALSFASVVTYTAFKDIPSSYIFCEQDQVVPPALQAQYIENIKIVAGRDVDIHKLNSNHVPNLTVTETLAELILKIAATP
ncbi:uncharacterized protein Z519_04222 [Cladophialophora bantiana CBS 173.52]|uniref:AB hydrolase-1 domain-containing protein n=1 Tax=Cladophialophora bantiana (strain ATCC 10958 / CBS 173.52 / CDC B-1940 / NIH 8579) TaxID=1442370 RepID=A0A0D2GAL3_CLAB1|nr:uncharacterized protein Z519_04222 [Cladophialophora bantiana CBS 173.52]KIW95637.1 hypothetical protein Z519_04222 [Cladophialophora bantiana CBS 173.52]